MALELALDYRLRWLDFDRYGRIQPVSVLDLCQDVATLQAENMGIGRDAMLERGVFWAAIRMRYEIVKPPEHHAVVRVKTWPHSPTNFSFMRDFCISSQSGEAFVKASTEWVLMNAETRKFERLRDHYSEEGDEYLADRMFDSKPRKLASFDEGNRPVVTMAPAFSDIDFNGHVNNARYLHFVVDALDLGPESAIRSMQIDYRHEVMPDVPLHVHTLVENGHAQAKGVRDDGGTAFVCSIELE